MAEIKKIQTFEDVLEIKSENFGQWQQIKNEEPDSTLKNATIQFAATDGSGIALAAISDEPLINKNTVFKIVKAGEKTNIVSVKIDPKKAAFLLYPVERNFINRYNYFRADLK